MCVYMNYLNSHRPQYELCLWLGEVSLDLWRHADQRTVGHNRYHTHGLKGQLDTEAERQQNDQAFRPAGHSAEQSDTMFLMSRLCSY